MNPCCPPLSWCTRNSLPIAALVLLGAIPELDAQEADYGPVVELPVYRVEAEAESDHFVQGPFLPDLQGAKINSGKKTTMLDLDALPSITANNYRQALAKAPGLVLSEETTPLVSIGYRGLEPHRAQFIQVLKDGIPIHADQFGYPEAYYTPPLDTVDRIEFVRGGGALMYGPQPGGALNFITHRPRTDREFAGSTSHTFGSHGLYSTFSFVDGTVGSLGYYAYYNHRQSDGFRAANSDYELDAFNVTLAIQDNGSARTYITLESYDEEHGEPGGLTFATSTNRVNYDADRNASSRLFDRFRLSRDFVTFTHERDFSRGTIVAKFWGGNYARFSKRQGGGGFGTLPTGASASTNTIELQKFRTFGAEVRGRIDWMGGNDRDTLSIGAIYNRTDSPRTDRRGQTADAEDGPLLNASQRDVEQFAVFAENRFSFGRLSIVPGVRIESIRQSVVESVNSAKTAAGTPLGNHSTRDTVVLLGAGATWDFTKTELVYANISESYRPAIFTQAVPTGGTTVINSDLEEGRAWQVELGIRGQPNSWLVYDTSVFLMDFDDQIGSVALPGGQSSVENVGRAVHRGWEGIVEVDFLELLGKGDSRSLTGYVNLTLLDAGFESGPRAGRTPQYAPERILRTGLIYRKSSDLKIALLGTFVSDSFADDSNAADRLLPAYMTWDLTAEWKIPGSPVRLTAGVNNLLDEDYYSRIRNDGIDPAPRRNYYAGVALEF
ncbi:MAG TPA: TonB-dependent receptor [Opitutaceae bacterium]